METYRDEGLAEVDDARAIRRAVVHELAAVEARVAQLRDRLAAAGAATAAEAERLRDVLDVLAAERALVGSRTDRCGDGIGAVIDGEAMRQGAAALVEEVRQSAMLHQDLHAITQVLATCRERLETGGSGQAPEELEDMRRQQAITAAREDERRRLAREVHDGPAQVLSNALFVVRGAEQVAMREPGRVADELRRVSVLLQDGAAEIRRFMLDLAPATLREQGLAPALRQSIDAYNRFFDKRIEVVIGESLPPLTADEALTVFRITQEALQNVRKHAMTDRARVELAARGGGVCLSILDDGCGFCPTAAATGTGGGAGLRGMRERAKSIGAELVIESGPGAGTEIRLTLITGAKAGDVVGAGASLAG